MILSKLRTKNDRKYDTEKRTLTPRAVPEIAMKNGVILKWHFQCHRRHEKCQKMALLRITYTSYTKYLFHGKDNQVIKRQAAQGASKDSGRDSGKER